jgi:hypothetical protein
MSNSRSFSPDNPLRIVKPLQSADWPSVARILPDAIVRLVEEIVAKWDGLSPLTEGEQLRWLFEWYTAYYQQSEVGSWDDNHVSAFDPASVPGLTDSDDGGVLVCDRCDVSDPDAPVVDEVRRIHIRHVLAGACESWHSASNCNAIEIVARDRRAFLGYEVSGSSWEGLSISWFGMFSDPEAVWAYLRSWGWLFDETDLNEAAEDRLLAMWDRDGGRRRKKRGRLPKVLGIGTEPPAFKMVVDASSLPPYA